MPTPLAKLSNDLNNMFLGDFKKTFNKALGACEKPASSEIFQQLDEKELICVLILQAFYNKIVDLGFLLLKVAQKMETDFSVLVDVHNRLGISPRVIQGGLSYATMLEKNKFGPIPSAFLENVKAIFEAEGLTFEEEQTAAVGNSEREISEDEDSSISEDEDSEEDENVGIE